MKFAEHSVSPEEFKLPETSAWHAGHRRQLLGQIDLQRTLEVLSFLSRWLGHFKPLSPGADTDRNRGLKFVGF